MFFLFFLNFVTSLVSGQGEKLIDSPQYSRLVFHSITTPIPSYTPRNYIIPPFNRSVDNLHQVYRSRFYVLPGEVDALEDGCLLFVKEQYGEDFLANGYKNTTTGTWYLPDITMAPIFRTPPPGAALLMFDSDNKHNAGVISAEEGGWYFQFETNGTFGGNKAGAERRQGMLGNCAKYYFYDPSAYRPNVEVRTGKSYNPSILTKNEWNLPVLYNDIQIEDEDGKRGQLTETIAYNYDKTKSNYIINVRTMYLTYNDPNLL